MRTHRILLPAVSRHPISDPMILILYTTLYREGGDKLARAGGTWKAAFPGRRVETLNVGWNARVLAFDSGPVQPGTVPPQSCP